MNHDLINVPKVLEESAFQNTNYNRPDLIRRRKVLRETVSALMSNAAYYYETAKSNLERWSSQQASKAASSNQEKTVAVFAGDWGEITQQLTREYGKCFAVLNMANAYVPGGGYLYGSIAQEENMFRRTDCHFTMNVNHTDKNGYYKKEHSDLINGTNGIVYLDTQQPRICIRGREIKDQEDLGYEWLSEDEIFPFYEMRSAAVDLRSGMPFSDHECIKRIRAQFNTLKSAGKRHVVLGAHGCGAYQNPPGNVADNYKKVICEFKNDFDVIAFAIFNAGYGQDNYSIFNKVLN